jgi:UDP-N-acetylglucosamine 2-epimerase
MRIYWENRMKIIACVGTTPEIIKVQPIIREIQKSKHELVFVHTGEECIWRYFISEISFLI